jgi:hypothetical protein
MADDPNHGTNQGEGNRDAAAAYDRDQQAFAKSGKVEPAARDAARAVSGKDAESLRQAEAEGKRHSHGEDPKLKK